MSKIECRYEDSLGKDECAYLDVHYSDDCYGGNQNEVVFELHNICGNYIQAELVDTKGDIYAVDLDKVKLKIYGQIEAGQFLEALQLIVETNKVVGIIKP
jgi:hypothetical protein